MTHRQTQHAASLPRAFTTTLEWYNAALAVAAVFCLLYYITAANSMAAQAWRLSDAQEQVSGLLEARNGLVSQQAAFEDREKLMVLAREAGLVPVESVVYLVQERPVAAR